MIHPGFLGHVLTPHLSFRQCLGVTPMLQKLGICPGFHIAAQRSQSVPKIKLRILPHAEFTHNALFRTVMTMLRAGNGSLNGSL